MALKWVEGFESYSGLVNFLQYRYSAFIGPSSTLVGGRALGYGLNFNGTSIITPNLGNYVSYYVGFAFQNVNLGASNIQMPVLQIQDLTTTQVSLTFNPSTGLFSVYTGATLTAPYLLGTGTFAITNGYWYYIELGVTVNSTIGTVTSKVNTVNDVVVGAGNTQVSANAYANTIQWRGPAGIGLGGAYQIDDIYVIDGSGAANNTFLGDMKVEGIQVIDSGNYAQWGVNILGTPNYQAVQTLNDGLYVLSNTPGQKDSYECNALNFITDSPTPIAGVSAVYWTRNTDSTQHTVKSLIRQGGVDYLGAPMTINNTAWRAYQTLWEQDPSTSTAWTVAGVGTAEFGQDLNS